MTALYLGLAALAGYVLCLVAACRIALRESCGATLPPATARKIRRAQKRQRADLRKALRRD